MLCQKTNNTQFVYAKILHMNTNKSKIKAIILDLDQTITTDEASWLQFTRILGADPAVHTQIYERFKLGKLTYPEAKTQLLGLWQMTGKSNRHDIIEAFEKIQLRDGAQEAIEYLKDKYQLCIISGAIDLFVQTIAEKLTINTWYASTRLKFDTNDHLVDFDYKLSRGEDKLQFLDDFCIKHEINPDQCAAIGDGESDMPIFSKVALPILFLAKDTTPQQISVIPTKMKDWSEIYNLL